MSDTTSHTDIIVKNSPVKKNRAFLNFKTVTHFDLRYIQIIPLNLNCLSIINHWQYFIFDKINAASSKFFIRLIIADSNQTVKENILLLPTVSVIVIAEMLLLHYTAVSEVL